MALLIIVLAIVFGCSLALALLLLLASSWLEEQYGARAAKALLGYVMLRIAVIAVAVGGMLGAAVWFVPPAHWRALSLLIGVAGLAGVGGLAYLWRRDRAAMGSVLLDLGHVGKKNTFVVWAVGGLGGLLMLVGLFCLDAVLFLHGIYLFCLGMGQATYDRAHLMVTERGMYAPEGSVCWSRIQAIEWLDGTHKICVLLIKTRRVFFHTQVMRIPWEFLNDVEAVIGEYLPDQVIPQAQPSRLSAIDETEPDV